MSSLVCEEGLSQASGHCPSSRVRGYGYPQDSTIERDRHTGQWQLEQVMETLDSDSYQCFTCDRIFKGRVFEIAREWERVHFSESIPEVEIEDSWGLECYCSQLCANLRLEEVMAREGVPIRHPDIGPIEPCSKCGAPIDMTQFHLTYVESCVDMHGFVAQPVDTACLAVVCSSCRPRHEARREMDVEQCLTGEEREKAFCDVANEIEAGQPQGKVSQRCLV
ncbi:hypothetical protein AWB78_04747 [Caballeronia calidae]|uniref:Uncharacterized protein n=1 Tax=Caballeronia calidae TaxID=1777139 RepID=A0A158D7F8_9BURK|nr:hypothetical protein AWB78_04747 [Caballeronia calidae]